MGAAATPSSRSGPHYPARGASSAPPAQILHSLAPSRPPLSSPARPAQDSLRGAGQGGVALALSPQEAPAPLSCLQANLLFLSAVFKTNKILLLFQFYWVFFPVLLTWQQV